MGLSHPSRPSSRHVALSSSIHTHKPFHSNQQDDQKGKRSRNKCTVSLLPVVAGDLRSLHRPFHSYTSAASNLPHERPEVRIGQMAIKSGRIWTILRGQLKSVAPKVAKMEGTSKTMGRNIANNRTVRLVAGNQGPCSAPIARCLDTELSGRMSKYEKTRHGPEVSSSSMISECPPAAAEHASNLSETLDVTLW